MCDVNPHIINFYNGIKTGTITPLVVREYLQKEAEILVNNPQYYYDVRNRFNDYKNSLDFLFLTRSCFNGIMRFNRKGNFNVPFCKNINRFQKAYITKIVNQVDRVKNIIDNGDFTFLNQDFNKTISMSRGEDIIYSDPPYFGLHADYYNSWNMDDELSLFNQLSSNKSKFMLSSWYVSGDRKNNHLIDLYKDYNIKTIDYRYQVAASSDNRNKQVLEALVMNF